MLAVPLLIVAAIVSGCRDRDGDEPDAAPTATTSDSRPATQTAKTAEPASNPGPKATVAQGEPGPLTDTVTMSVGGRERTYRLYVPASLPDGPAPLVIGLHGGFGSGEQFAHTGRFDAQAEAGAFIAAYPDGTGIVPTWNGGRCCGYAVREDVDDIAFVEAVIDDIAGRYAIDPSRVYATGHSNGAIMALRLACESDRFAAVAAVAGSLEIPSCNPPHPASVLMIHGDADESHPLEGGSGDKSVSQVDFTSVAASMDMLAPAMGCSTVTDVGSSGPLVTTDWTACPDGTAVRLIVVGGASHAWPGGIQGAVFRAEPSDALDATAAIWDFFDSLPD
jgi:polyhydroxybutyrate depolymerase